MIDELRRIHRRQIARLRALSVPVEELSREASMAALTRFAKAFLGAERTGDFLTEVIAAQASGREVDYGRWLWQGAPLPALKPRFGWLSDWMPGTTCVRFDRRVAFPALRLAIPAMADEWAFSWPGAYASFDKGRAILVSLDGEVTCFELSPTGRSHYR